MWNFKSFIENKVYLSMLVLLLLIVALQAYIIVKLDNHSQPTTTKPVVFIDSTRISNLKQLQASKDSTYNTPLNELAKQIETWQPK